MRLSGDMAAGERFVIDRSIAAARVRGLHRRLWPDGRATADPSRAAVAVSHVHLLAGGPGADRQHGGGGARAGSDPHRRRARWAGAPTVVRGARPGPAWRPVGRAPARL